MEKGLVRLAKISISAYRASPVNRAEILKVLVTSGGPWVFALGIHKGRRGDDASRGLASGKNSKTCPLESRKMPPILKIKLFSITG